MKIAVTDANIFIDILSIDLQLFLPLLNLEIYTTELVLGELEPDQIAQLVAVRVYQFTSEEQTTLEAFQVKKGLTDADHSVIYLAEILLAMVISGDALVRKTCQERKLEVHGMLWLLDECVQKGHLTPEQAHSKLLALMSFNTRLPKKDCDDRLEKWNRQFRP